MGKAAARPKRMAFKFNEPGKFEAEGNRLRMKSKLEQLQVSSQSDAIDFVHSFKIRLFNYLNFDL